MDSMQTRHRVLGDASWTRGKSVNGPNAARDKPISMDLSTQLEHAAWQDGGVVHLSQPSRTQPRSIQTPRKVDGPRRKICGMLKLAFHKVLHTSPGLACSPDKAKSRCWAPQAGSVAEEAPPAKTTPPQSRSPDSTCRRPLPLPKWQTRRAGRFSYCQIGRLDALRFTTAFPKLARHKADWLLPSVSLPSLGHSPSQSAGRSLLRRGERRRRTSQSTTTV